MRAFYVCVYALGLSGCFRTIQVISEPSNAVISASGSRVGTGTADIEIEKERSVAISVCAPPDYLCQDFTVGYDTNSPFSVQLPRDEAYAATAEAAAVTNKNLSLPTKKGRAFDETWQKIVGVISQRYDVLESTDARSGYLRTAWIERRTGVSTVRARFVVSIEAQDPLTFRVKLQSERQDGRTDYVPYPRAFPQDLEVLEALRARIEQ